MNVLVLGATGFIGSHITSALVAAGHSVTTISRPQNFSRIPGSVVRSLVHENPESLVATELNGIDWLVDAAAPYPLSMFVEPAFYRTASKRQALLIDAAISTGTGLCQISSFVTCLAAHDSYSRFKRRSSPYYVVKQRLEEQIQHAVKTRQLKAAILNPTACIGPGDEKPDALIRLLMTAELPVALEATVNILDVRDLARMVLQTLTADQPCSPQLVTGTNVRVSELCQMVEEITGSPSPWVMNAPAPVAGVGTAVLEAATHTLGLGAPLPGLLSFLLTEAPVPEMAPRGEIPLSQSVQDTVNWHRFQSSLPGPGP